MLLVAAGVVALVGAGVFFLRPKEETPFRPPAEALFSMLQGASDCAFADVEDVARVSDLPKPVTDDLYGRLRDFTLAGEPAIAEKGQPFNPTDIADTKLPMRRLIRAGRSGDCLFVWYEHGGRAYHVHAILYRVTGSGNAPELLGNRVASGAAQDW
jgi:hypothetical protein